MNRIFLTLTLTFTACFGPSYEPYDTNFNPVFKVIDSNTVEFNLTTIDRDAGNNITVKSRGKLLGIDIPVKSFALKAITFTKKWIATHDEWIEHINNKDDPDGVDRYKQHLIWIMSKGAILNVELVRQGLARVKLDGNKYLRYKKELRKAETEAKEDKKGIWSK